MRRFSLIILVVMVGLLAAGCDYPSDSKQIKNMEKFGFTNCSATESASWDEYATALCDYRSGDGKQTCKALIEISDEGDKITGIDKAKCEVTKHG